MTEWARIKQGDVLRCALCIVNGTEVFFHGNRNDLQRMLYLHRDKTHPDAFIGDVWEFEDIA